MIARTTKRSWAVMVALALGAESVLAAPASPRFTGELAVREWTRDETGGRAQSFSVLQHPDTGIVHVGNEAGVMEFDGVRWRLLPSPVGSPSTGVAVRGLAWDDQGRLWGAADNDVVVWEADDRGNWQPSAVRSRSQTPLAEWGTVWEARFHDGFIWCTTTVGVLRIDPHSYETVIWAFEDSVADLGELDGDLWFRLGGNRFLRVRAGGIEEPSLPPLPADDWVLGLVRASDGILQAEHAGGLRELKDGVWVARGDELARKLDQAGTASRVLRLPDGRRFFSTRSRTLVVADEEGSLLGELVEPLNTNFGVSPRTYLDRDGGIWMANASGIRRAQIDGVVTRHGPAQGLRGGARSLAFDGEKLLVASAQGLFVRDASTGGFTLQTGSSSDGQALLPSPGEGWLMAAGQRFDEWYQGTRISLPGAPTAGLSLAADPRDAQRIFAGGFGEVMVYRRRADDWRQEARIANGAASVYSVATDAAGRLWMSAWFGYGLWRAEATGGDWTKALPERLDGEAGGPPAARWRVVSLEGEVLMIGTAGVWREAHPGGPLVRDQRFGELPRGAATPVGGLASSNADNVIFVAGDLEWSGRIWRGSRADRSVPWRFLELPMIDASGLELSGEMRESPDGKTLWLGGSEAAYSVDLSVSAAEIRRPEARWRSLRPLDGGAAVFGGAGELPTAVALPRGQRAIRVDYAASVLRAQLGGRTGLEYRTRAAGVDRDWTGWSATAERDLTNLPPGDVKLELQARNSLGTTGPIATLVLAVPLFWWETWWARGMGLAVGIILVAFAVHAGVRRRFRHRIARLEAQAAVQQERLRIARDLHDDVGSTLASIVHLSSGGPTAEPGAESATTVLARIQAAALDLVHRTRDIVWAVTPHHDSLESLIEQLAGHAERTLRDREIQVTAELPAEVPEMIVGAAARHDLFLAFKEAVNNAAKHARARHITVRIEVKAGELTVTLRDDGIGFDAEKSREGGYGLGNLRQRLLAHGGKAEIVSTVDQGTIVSLRLPVGAARD